MQKKTRCALRCMMILLKRKKAHFYYDEDGQMRYTYPKHGWSEFRDVTGYVGVRQMVTKEETTTKIMTKITWRCDICGNVSSKHNCDICGCDVCSACSHDVEEYWHYCPKCWGVGEMFRKEFEEEQEFHNEKQNDILRRWERAVDVKIGEKKS